MGKPQASASKKSKKYHNRYISSMGYFGKDRGSQRSNSRSPSPSVASARSVDNPKPRCKHCNTFIWRVPMRSGYCYRCGSLDHYLKDCPERLEKDIVQTSKPSNPASRGRPPCNPYNMSDSRVSNPLGQYVMVDKVCKNCPLMVRGYCFSIDLMLFPFDEFDVILGMDWLTQHGAMNGELLCIESDKLDGLSNKYIRKGYDAYLAYVLDTKVSESKIKSVPVVCEFPDVFLEELLGLSPVREVEFSIDLVPGTTPISIAPYRMAPNELKELKAQLQ
ncbi:RVP_2 domain-containing protein [Gossypium australe]|uniref:RVP_2 domain-containing protein n=1 Tax=Gossypium australe TaxID=47621 RepID=A0A5B6UXY2_9ROSI|nr:RVP_2 domain-containing protein [Gossypium australe]